MTRVFFVIVVFLGISRNDPAEKLSSKVFAGIKEITFNYSVRSSDTSFSNGFLVSIDIHSKEDCIIFIEQSIYDYPFETEILLYNARFEPIPVYISYRSSYYTVSETNLRLTLLGRIRDKSQEYIQGYIESAKDTSNLHLEYTLIDSTKINYNKSKECLCENFLVKPYDSTKINIWWDENEVLDY